MADQKAVKARLLSYGLPIFFVSLGARPDGFIRDIARESGGGYLGYLPADAAQAEDAQRFQQSAHGEHTSIRCASLTVVTELSPATLSCEVPIVRDAIPHDDSIF